MNERIWYLRTQDETFGPETREQLVTWAKLGRIQPGQEISNDNDIWQRVEDVPFLDMRFSIDIGDGNPRGPFNREAATALLASGRLPPTATLIETRPPFETPDETPAAPAEPTQATLDLQVSTVPEPETRNPEPETINQKPETGNSEPEPGIAPQVIDKIVEKIVEVPVEKIVEKIVEKRVEVPVEKIVEKIVIDETRVKELEGLLEEERRHTSDIQSRMDEAMKTAAENSRQWTERAAAYDATIREKDSAYEALAREKDDALQAKDALLQEKDAAIKDAAKREEKLVEQVRNLEDELRRLPQAASEVADIQAAVYKIMSEEADEINALVEAEKREADEFRRRHEDRAGRLQERRRLLLKRAGANVEEMTKRALVERPEDPRATQLRHEYEEFRRITEKQAREREQLIARITEELNQRRTADVRAAANSRDLTELHREAQQLREQLQLREKDLMAERQKCEALRQQQAASQQAMLARLATLESPSIGTVQSIASNQSREAKLVKLPRWMRIGS